MLLPLGAVRLPSMEQPGRGRAGAAHRGLGLISLPPALLLLQQEEVGPMHSVAGQGQLPGQRDSAERTEGRGAALVPWAELFPTSSLLWVYGEGRIPVPSAAPQPLPAFPFCTLPSFLCPPARPHAPPGLVPSSAHRDVGRGGLFSPCTPLVAAHRAGVWRGGQGWWHQQSEASPSPPGLARSLPRAAGIGEVAGTVALLGGLPPGPAEPWVCVGLKLPHTVPNTHTVLGTAVARGFSHSSHLCCGRVAFPPPSPALVASAAPPGR